MKAKSVSESVFKPKSEEQINLDLDKLFDRFLSGDYPTLYRGLVEYYQWLRKHMINIDSKKLRYYDYTDFLNELLKNIDKEELKKAMKKTLEECQN